MTAVSLTLLERADCHLCSAAKEIVNTVVEQLANDPHSCISVDVSVIDIDADSELQNRYDWEVPVVLINNRQHSFHRVDPVRLNKALRRQAQVSHT